MKFPLSNINNQIVETAITQTIPATETDAALNWTIGENSDAVLQRKIGQSRNAYLIDGMIKNTVDRHVDVQGGIRLRGNKKQVEYLKRRLMEISLKTNTPWESIITQLWEEYWKTGTATLLKFRGTASEAFRPLYKNTPYPIETLEVMNSDRIDPTRDSETHKVCWRYPTSIFNKLVGNPANLSTSRALIDDLILSKPNLLLEGRDVIVLAYKRPPGCNYGIGLVFAALDDVRVLRQLESATSFMLKKTMIPLTHIKVTGNAYGIGDIGSSIRDARDKIQSMSPDSYYITGPNQEVKVHGFESHSLRLHEYFNHFSRRSMAGLCASPFEIGFEKGNIGDAEAASDLRNMKVKTAESLFMRVLENFLINELLYEGGWDPYRKTEDQVKLEFIDVDMAYMRRIGNFWADLVTKNIVSLDEGRKFIKELDGMPTLEWLYVNYVEVPKIEAKGEQDQLTVQTKVPTPSTKKEEILSRNAREFLDNILDISKDRYKDLANYLELYFEIDLWDKRTTIEKLLNDFAEDHEAKLEAFSDLIIKQHNERKL